MSVAAAYFDNHRRVRRFPWRLYHAALENELAAFLCSVCEEHAGSGPPNVLVVGCGLLAELDRAPAGIRLTAVDIDARAVEQTRASPDPRIVAAHVVTPEQDLRELGSFDAVYAKEVIEHIPSYAAYLRRLSSVLKPGGRLWLSTPNYGEPWLPAIEYTLLEAVARVGGYTRFGMHPAKFSARRLSRALRDAGFVGVDVRPVSFRLALVARARAAGGARDLGI